MPSHLDNIIGQDNVRRILSKLLESGRIPNAQLFTGPMGVGKHNTAIQFIKEIAATYSGNSKSIQSIQNLEEPFLKYVIPLPRGRGEDREDNAVQRLSAEIIENISSEISKKAVNPFYNIQIESANNIKISSIREIRKFISLDFEDIGPRFILVSNAEMMSQEAQNALLKSLEEPPEAVHFIILTQNSEALLPTIISRCQTINFNPLTEDQVSFVLEKYFTIPKETAKLVSQFSEGSVNSAVSLFDSDMNKLLDKTINILRFSMGRRYNTAYNLIKEIIDTEGVEKLKEIISLMQKWFSEVERDRYKFGLIEYEEFKETINKFNQKFGKSDLSEIRHKLNSYKSVLDRNINLNLVILNIIFEIGHLGAS